MSDVVGPGRQIGQHVGAVAIGDRMRVFRRKLQRPTVQRPGVPRCGIGDFQGPGAIKVFAVEPG